MRQKWTELQRGRDESTIVVGDFNTPLSQMDRFSRQKISNDVVKLNRNINHLDKTGIYRLIQHEQNTHFSQAHMEYPPKQTIFSHKAHLNEFKRIKIIQCLFSGHMVLIYKSIT